MKRFIMSILLIVFLSGCHAKNNEMERVLDMRRELNSGVECTYDALITADYGDKLYLFTLKCQVNNMGNLSFVVEEPKSIAGVSGNVNAETGTLTFDDKILTFSLLADGQVTPVSAPWIMMETLRGGYIKSCGKDDALFRVVFDDSYEEEPIQVDIWFDENNHPVNADFLWQGHRIITMEIKNFRYL